MKSKVEAWMPKYTQSINVQEKNEVGVRQRQKKEKISKSKRML